MAINVSRAGRLIISEDGYVHAPLETLEIEPGDDSSQLKWGFKVQTSKNETFKYLWSGVNVNPQKSYYPVDANGVVAKTPEYNKLTTLLLSLGIITELQLHSDEEIDFDLETLIGRQFKFKMLPVKPKEYFSDIDLKTIRFAEAAEPKQSKLTVSKSTV